MSMHRQRLFDSPETIRMILRDGRSRPAPVPPRAATIAQHEIEVGAAAARLRAQGYPWPDIADALGVASMAKLRGMAARSIAAEALQGATGRTGEAIAGPATHAPAEAERTADAQR